MLIFLRLLLAVPSTALGHDVGVTRVEIVDQSDGRYVMSAEVPSALAYLFGPPTLPEGFELLGDAVARPSATGQLRFEFERVGEPLRAGEEIVADWPREGLMVQMRWADGSTVSRLFQGSAGTTRIEMVQLQAGSGSLAMTANRYTRLGVEHTQRVVHVPD